MSNLPPIDGPVNAPIDRLWPNGRPAGFIAADSPEGLAKAAQYKAAINEAATIRANNETVRASAAYNLPRTKEEVFAAEAARIERHNANAAATEAKRLAAIKGKIPAAPELWPEPLDVFKELSAPAFSGYELPPALAEYPLLISQETGFDPGIGLNAALSVASMAINDCVKVCANSATKWTESARLWVLVIAPPGTGKTPAQAPLIEPLWAIHKKLYDEWLAAMDAWNAIPKKTRPRNPPVALRVLLTDTTIAKLSDVLVANPRGIGLVVDEFSSWLGALDMQAGAGAGGHDRGEALMLFEGKPHQTERVLRGSIYVPNWSAGILTASTPSQMQRYSKHLPEDGLIQRFVPYFARDKAISIAVDPQQMDGARQRYETTIQKLWDLRPLTGMVQMTPEAKSYFMEWSAGIGNHVKAYRELLPPLAGHISKYASIALRVALTLHCVKIVNGPPAAHGMYDVASRSLDLATITASTEYLAAIAVHAKVMYQDLNGGSPAIVVARDVARYLMVRKEPESHLARRDLLRHVNGYTTAPEAVQRDAMRLLEEMGWVRVTEGGRLRDTGPTRYATNPRIATVFKAQAIAEAARRAVAMELIGAAAKKKREEPA